MVASYHKPTEETDGAERPPARALLGYRGDLAETLPPIPIRELFAASGVTLYLLTADPAFEATVRGAAGEQYPLFVVGAWEELFSAVKENQCGVALIDATLLGGEATAEVLKALRPYANRLVTLVATDRALAKELVALASSMSIHRLLIKPVPSGAARLFIDSAVERRLQLQAPQHAADSRSQRWRLPIPPVWAAGGAALTLGLLGALGWWALSPRPGVEAAASAPPPTAEALAAAAADQRLADLRARAELALQEGRLTEPPGDAAIDHYLTILALAPGDADARRGIVAVTEFLFASVETALLEQSYEAAAKDLDQLRRADPSSSRLAFLDAQLVRAMAASAATPPPSAAAASAPTGAIAELDSVLSLAAARLARGELLTPAGDSAIAYLERAMRIDAEDERVVALRREVAAAVLAAARVLANADVAGATSLAQRARGLGADAAALTRLDSELGAARQRAADRGRAERVGVVQERIRQGALFAPEDSALSELKSLQSEAPETEGLAEAWDEFKLAVATFTTESTESGDWDRAGEGVAALREAPEGDAVAGPLAAEIDARRLQASYLANAAPAGELMLLRAPPAVYPPEAVQRGIEGWVEVEFVVDRTGATRDAIVRQADPPQRFDAAALSAVANYRYAPFERDGRQYERRVRLRIRFDLE
jgi:TonB family protein